MIGLVDGNNFYVSCERIFNPSLEGKPVAVLSNNDGCVISRSNEFKALKIDMGTPYFQIKPMIEPHGLILKSSNYELYGDISQRVIATLGEFTPDVEQYSIDEAFIHVTKPAGTDYLEYGKTIRQTVLQWVGIPCGVGFATSKTLAKIANHIGKKLPSGVYVMPDEAADVLSRLPVSEVWGVGRALAPKLERIGIRSAWQLALANPDDLRKRFSVTLAKTILELRGERVIEHEDPEKPSNSVSCSRSFGSPVTELSDLKEAVAHYTAIAAEKLRKENLRATSMSFYYQLYPEYSPTPAEGGFTSHTLVLQTPSASTTTLLNACAPFLDQLYVPNRRYKKAGVLLFGLESKNIQQLDLFADTARDEKATRLAEVMDKINAQSGKRALFHLAEGLEKPWAMKREFKSPCFTTQWNEIPTAK